MMATELVPKKLLPRLATAVQAQNAHPGTPAVAQTAPSSLALAARSKDELLRPLTKADYYSEGKKPLRVSSGIPGLDEQMEGGFEGQSQVVITGDSGSGKTTFCLQYLYGGAKLGEPGVFITFEEKKRDIFRRALRYGWDLAKLEREKKLAVLEYPPHEMERFLSEGQIVEDIIRDMGAKRLVIDSITSFALLFEDDYKRRQGLTSALNTMRKWGCTTMMTSEAHLLPNSDIRTRFGLSFLSDALVYLYNMRRGDKRVRALEIFKMRGTDHATSIMPMSFGKTGITIYPDQPVFGQAQKF
ncbi:MAG: ATPase domain-containing protein [Candidatus Micrarchaeia archaeon]|jgi:KaiC/GvpD/RAD55 family RecA-like ATPase